MTRQGNHDPDQGSVPAPPPGPITELVMELARESFHAGEVPVGSVIAHVGTDDKDQEHWKVIAAERNRILEKQDPTAHAELLAVRAATRKLQTERLSSCRLVTTLEPCLMCTGALVLARVDMVYYFAPGLKGISMDETIEFSRTHNRLNHHPRLIHLLTYEKPAAEMLRSFFVRKR